MKSIPRIGSISLAGIALCLSSCATGGRSPSGFLTNYKQLDSGYGTADAVTTYRKPGVNYAKYDSVLIDPVTTVVSTPGISPEVKNQLAANLSDALRSQSGGKLKIVSTPGSSTLRIRTALTDVVENQKLGKPVKTVHTSPQATLTGALGSAIIAEFISDVSFEGEIQDSVTGERLGALVDHRLGSKREATATTTWASVRSATNQGAIRLWQLFSGVADQ
jgi:PBP1b-binding outer membrane lipoprotein LpoB